jgi:hypothetical protein
MGVAVTENLPPSIRRELDDMKREIRKLWMAVNAPQSEVPILREVIFSFAGEVEAGDGKNSGPWRGPSRVTISSVTLGIEQVAVPALTFVLFVDGITAGTYVLAGGSASYHEATAINVPYGSPVVGRLTGVGGSDFTATVRYVAS